MTKNNRPKYINVLASSTLALSLVAGVAAPSVGAAGTSYYSATTGAAFSKQITSLKVTATDFEGRVKELQEDLAALSTTETATIKSEVTAKLEKLAAAVPTVNAYNALGDIKAATTTVKGIAPTFTKGTLATTADVASAVENATASLDTVTVKLKAFEEAYPTSDAAVIALVKSFQSKVNGLDKAVVAKEKELASYIAADKFLVAADQVPKLKDVKSKGLKTAADLVTKAADLYTTEDAIKIVAALEAYNALKKPAADATSTDTALAKEALKTKAVKDAYKEFSQVQKDYQVQEKLQVKAVETDINKLNRKLTNYVASVDSAVAAYNALEQSNEAVFKAIKAGTVEKLKGHAAAANFVSTVDTAFTSIASALTSGTTYDTALVKKAVNVLSSEDIATVKADLERIQKAAEGTLDTNAKADKAAKGLIKSDLKTINELLTLIDARVKALGNTKIAGDWNEFMTELTWATSGENALDLKKDFKKLTKPQLVSHLEEYSGIKTLAVQARDAYSKLSKDEQKLVPKAELKVLTDVEGYFKKELAAVKTLYKTEITNLTNDIKALKTAEDGYAAKFAAVRAQYEVEDTDKVAIRDAVAASSLEKFAQHAMVLDFAKSFKAGASLATNDAGKITVTTDDVAGIDVFKVATQDAAALTFTVDKAKALATASTKDTAEIARYNTQVGLYLDYYNAFGEDKLGKALKSLVSTQQKILNSMKKELEKAK